MNDMTPVGIGHNNPPDPIEDALAGFDAAIQEAQNWLDGSKVENLDQMNAVDALAKQIRAARSAVDKARDDATKPLHDAWKAEVARWKPTQDDLDRIQKGLAKIVSDFKAAEKAKREAAEAEAKRISDEKARAAREAALHVDEGDIESVRAADAAKREAEIAAAQTRKVAAQAKAVKGLRTVTKWSYETDPATDPRGARRP
ncbi:hypothetical protein, partial [Pseudogemmobacter sonorensis]|uniref:hypothetical protein n=1 Tax=Pseudogemmobacter sonorensis TaxID=2989681 RepID=UPI0036955286